MIPLRRTTTKSLETTLLSYSRQALPRPARLYSTPSTTRHNAYLAQSLPPKPELPPYISKLNGRKDSTVPEDMHNFLKRVTPYTILPTPLPADQKSHLNDTYFTDSPTQDLLAVIDACLHNLYDVPRAKQTFERLQRPTSFSIPTFTIHCWRGLSLWPCRKAQVISLVGWRRRRSSSTPRRRERRPPLQTRQPMQSCPGGQTTTLRSSNTDIRSDSTSTLLT